MSNLKKSKFAISRSIGHSVHDNPKDSIKKRAFVPGQHGKTVMRKKDNYSNARKNVKFILNYYGIKFYQLKKYYSIAKSQKGDPANELLRLLNLRLSSCVFYANFGKSFYSGGQLISHRHILVNGKKINISSYLLKLNDVVSISDKAKNISDVKNAIQDQTYKVPEFIKLNEDKTSFTLIREPYINDIAYSYKVDYNSIVEYLSR